MRNHVGDSLKREGLDLCQRFIVSGPIDQHARKLSDLSDPLAIFFASAA